MGWEDLARRARNQAARRPNVIRAGSGHHVLLLQIFDGGNMPTTTPGQFLGHPATFGGTLTENAAFTPLVDASRHEVVTVYGSPPAVGDFVLAERRGGKWVAVNWPGDAKIIDPPGACPVVVVLRGCPGYLLDLPAAVLAGGTVTIDGVVKVANQYGETYWNLDPGSYTADVTALGYAPISVTFTVPGTCTGPSSFRVVAQLSPDADHTCCLPCRNRIAKKAWYITDSNGTWPFNTPSSGCPATATGQAMRACLDWEYVECDVFGAPCTVLMGRCSTVRAVSYSYALMWVGGTYFRLSGVSNVPVTLALDADQVTCDTVPDPYNHGCATVLCYDDVGPGERPNPRCPGSLPVMYCVSGIYGDGPRGTSTPSFAEYGIFADCDVNGTNISGQYLWQGPEPLGGYPTDGHFEIGT